MLAPEGSEGHGNANSNGPSERAQQTPPGATDSPARKVTPSANRFKAEEKEVFPTPSTIQKKDLLHQKLIQKEQDLRQAQDKLRAADRQIKGLNTQLSDVKRSRREIQAELDALKDKASVAPPSREESVTSPPSSVTAQDNSTEAPAAAGPRLDQGDEHEALAAKLLENGLKLDMATVAAAAAGLKDTSVLEGQLRRARQDVARLQAEIQQLNDTVFSKSFKPPSAWADREVKYKAEKRDWEHQAANLNEQIKRLTAENEAYRDSNKAAEFEEKIKVLNAAVSDAIAEKTAAQQSLHELELKMRELKSRRLSPRESRGPENESVLKKILSMEDKSQGGQKPSPQRAASQRLHEVKRTSSPIPTAKLANASNTSSPTARVELQDIIDDYDDQGIRMARPLRKKRSRKEKPEAFLRDTADASASESAGYDSNVDVGAIKQELRDRGNKESLPRSRSVPSSESADSPTNADTHPSVAVHSLLAEQDMERGSRAANDHSKAETHSKENGSVPMAEKSPAGPMTASADGEGSMDTQRAVVSAAPMGANSASPDQQVAQAASTVSVLDRSLDLAGSTPVMPTEVGRVSQPGGHVLDAAASSGDVQLAGVPDEPAGMVIIPDTVRQAALGLGEDGSAPRPDQTQQGSSTAEPGADSDARAKSETTGVAPVLPSDVRDQGASPAGPVETPAAPGSTSRVDTAVRPGEEHPAEGASSQGAANEGPELQYDSPWEAASSLQDETAQASKQALPTVPSKPAGLDEEQKAAASNQELPQIVVSQGADSAAAGTLEEDVKVESDRQTHSGNPSLPEALQGEEQQEGNREAAVDASIALEGPMSPVSPFAAEDTGHLTGMLDESDANRSALKGAAAAVALARRRSHGDLPDITNGLQGHMTKANEQQASEVSRMRLQMSAIGRRKDLLNLANDKLLTRGSSDGDSPWTREDFNALQAERNAVEEELLEHLADQDVKQLKWRAALMESRVEMHEAQITKMQRALEEADQEKARIEEDLEVALKAMQSVKPGDAADQQKLQSIRDRLREEGGKTAESARVTQEALQHSYREVQTLQKHRNTLQKQLGDIATKINSGMIPDPEDLELPDLQSAGSEPTRKGSAPKPASIRPKRSLRQFNSFVEGLSDEEIEIMNLRQENENVMDTLVRTKVELAETQGDYLKMRRALIRAVEKQAAITDRLESIKYAVGENDLAAVKKLVQENLKQIKGLGGDIESLGERDLF